MVFRNTTKNPGAVWGDDSEANLIKPAQSVTPTPITSR